MTTATTVNLHGVEALAGFKVRFVGENNRTSCLTIDLVRKGSLFDHLDLFFKSKEDLDVFLESIRLAIIHYQTGKHPANEKMQMF